MSSDPLCHHSCHLLAGEVRAGPTCRQLCHPIRCVIIRVICWQVKYAVMDLGLFPTPKELEAMHTSLLATRSPEDRERLRECCDVDEVRVCRT